MSSKIATAGQLREYLAMMLLGVKNGDIDPIAARNMVKLAAQINESFYAEIKIAKTMLEAGKTMADLGALELGDTSKGTP